MATLRDSLLPVINNCRRIIDDLGFRTARVIVRTKTWTSGRIQTGDAFVEDLELDPVPSVVGTAGDPKLTVTKLTPSFARGGYTPAQLNPADSPGVEFVYIIIGPDEVERAYRLAQIDLTGSLGYTLKLEALNRAVPF